MSKKMKFAAILLTAALPLSSALAGGDGRPCFWKGGDDAHKTTRTVAESPIPDASAEPAIPDENIVGRLDDSGGPAGSPEFLE